MFTLRAPGRLTILLHRLELHSFRNYASLQLDLRAPRLLVLGNNGEGKSNLLEAVELLGSLRSHRCSSDRDLIQRGAKRSRLRAQAGPEADDDLVLELRRQGGRWLSRNGKVLERHADLIGPLRCVGFSALDLELVRGEPALRRAWLDRVVQQLEPVYSELLSRHGRLMRQRSQLLRRPLDNREAVLDALDQQLAVIGTRLHRRRHRALRRLEPLAAPWQERLSGGREQLQLTYMAGTELKEPENEQQWQQALLEQLRLQRPKEERLGYCQVGPQRDDVALLLGGEPARRLGSAGQQRCLVLALKLAELELVQQLSGVAPLLLLDDVLAELDPQRQQLLLEAIGEGHQCLVSATHLQSCVDDWRQRAQLVEIRAGAIQQAGN
ncbi:MAG: DNA replication/repair protein RecF [Synechococcus sp.]|nr:DNA replication/repair protein RecF [Synechococcus sp.]